MKTLYLPYGRNNMPLNIPDDMNYSVYNSGLSEYRQPENGAETVRLAMEHPIGTRPLHELAAGKNKVVIIASDHTRPVPSRMIMPLMLQEIRAGNPDADITILIATGLHRSTSRKELVNKFGKEIVDNERIVIHDCDDSENMTFLGTLPSGGRLVINRLAAEADLLVSEGFIEPHFFAGFSGGRKSVLPGIASRETVMYNHNSSFIASKDARTGVLENNPIHADMLFAARAARLAFIVNVVIDAHHDPIFAVAGDCELAHKAGREFLLNHCCVYAEPADVVITTNGGYPMDQNIYQSVKGMTAAEAAIKDGGIIIMASECSDGHGGKSFYETFKAEDDNGIIMEKILSRSPADTIPDQWQSQIFARVLMKARIIFISSYPDELVREMHMIPARSFEEAFDIAIKMHGHENFSLNIIPDGVSVIVNPGRRV
ncbi:MAG: nickel-dependent lactate racemase [Spirochaetia bacterium]|nr:nickel-dependent lactate racemase [Spirochaetia bacterium]